MKDGDVGEVIAERRLVLTDDPARDVSIVIGKPVKADDTGDFVCRFQLRGVDRVRYAVGVDSLQSLQEALFLVRPVLHAALERHPTLRWLDAAEGDFGRDVSSDRGATNSQLAAWIQQALLVFIEGHATRDQRQLAAAHALP